jgi:hypothetical protein
MVVVLLLPLHPAVMFDGVSKMMQPDSKRGLVFSSKDKSVKKISAAGLELLSHVKFKSQMTLPPCHELQVRARPAQCPSDVHAVVDEKCFAQAWESDKLNDDWELERTVDGGREGRRTVHLQGSDGIVNKMVHSVLDDLMQPLLPCSVSECQPSNYPESEAVPVAAQARARVLIYLKTLTRARIDVAVRRVAASPHPPSSPPLSSVLSHIFAAILRRELWGQMSVTRRVTLLALVLLAAVALLKLSRGSILRAVGLLFRYSRR